MSRPTWLICLVCAFHVYCMPHLLIALRGSSPNRHSKARPTRMRFSCVALRSVTMRPCIYVDASWRIATQRMKTYPCEAGLSVMVWWMMVLARHHQVKQKVKVVCGHPGTPAALRTIVLPVTCDWEERQSMRMVSLNSSHQDASIHVQHDLFRSARHLLDLRSSFDLYLLRSHHTWMYIHTWIDSDETNTMVLKEYLYYD